MSTESAGAEEPRSGEGVRSGAGGSSGGADSAGAAGSSGGAGASGTAGTSGVADSAGAAGSANVADSADAASASGGAEAGEGGAAEGSEAGAEPSSGGSEADGSDGSGGAEAYGGDGSGGAEAGDGAGGPDNAELSEAEAELAAQRELRERIEKRKAEKGGPIASGGKLSGTAADLLAAVRAVESGAKPVSRVAEEPPAPRDPAPVRTPAPVRAAPVSVPAASPAPSAVEAVRAVLARGGAPQDLAARTAALLGEGAEQVLLDDPWQLLRVAGVRPEHADGFARALLGDACGPGDERRGRALTGWLLEQAAAAGHTALDADVLKSALAGRAVPDPDAAVESAVAEGEVLVFEDAADSSPQAPAASPAPSGDAEDTGAEDMAEEAGPPVRVLFGLERYALAEESLADGLARVLNSAPKEAGSPPSAWDEAAARVRGSAAELIRAVGEHMLVLHTGGELARSKEPAALLDAAARLGLRVCGLTHTPEGRTELGRALAEDGAGTAAVATVGGLLAGTEGPGRDGEGALAVDLLVVLDAPQLDVESAAMLVESLPDGARLVLSGDPGVLWSTGAGRVFADLLAAKVCPQIVSRTPDPGPVGELVSGIGIGELNQVAAPDKEVVIVPARDPGEAVHRTVQLVADSIPRAFGIPADSAQVVTVGHGGAAGTRALNAALKERLNPGPGRFGGFDPGDRVACAASAGRVLLARVVGADAEGLRLEGDGGVVVVPKDRVESEVRHAWALTAQEALGRRWAAVVAVLPGDAARALTRAWVYSAFGRAARHLSVVHGVEGALAHAVAEVPAKPRTTRLERLLRAQVPGGD